MRERKTSFLFLILCGLVSSLFLTGCGNDRKKAEEAKRTDTVKAVCELMFTYPSSQVDELWAAMEEAAETIGEGVEDGKAPEEKVNAVEEMMEEMYGEYFTEDGYISFVSTGEVLYPIGLVIGTEKEMSLKSVEEIQDSSKDDKFYQYEAVIELNGEEIHQTLGYTFDGEKISTMEYLDQQWQEKFEE